MKNKAVIARSEATPVGRAADGRLVFRCWTVGPAKQSSLSFPRKRESMDLDPRHIFGEEHQVPPEKCSRKGRAAKCSAHVIVGNTSKLPRLVLAHWRLHWARALKHMRLCRSAAPLHSGMTFRVRLLRPRFIFCLAMTMVFFSHLSSTFACPFCKEAIVKMGQIWTSVGFNLSIYLMIATPFLLVGSFALALYLNYRKHNGSC